MKKTANQLLKENPDLDPAIVGIAEELDEKHALSALADTEGGKLLLNSLLVDIASIVGMLRTTYKDGSHIDVITLCARLDSTLSMYQALKRARANTEQLKEILADALT